MAAQIDEALELTRRVMSGEKLSQVEIAWAIKVMVDELTKERICYPPK